MKKDEFLEILKSKLEILDEEEVKDIIDEYSEHIDEKIKDGSTEKEAIDEFGDIDELVDGILSAYKINKNYSKKEKLDSFIDEILISCKQVFDKTIKIITHGTFKEVFQLFIFIIIAILICLILHIPFSIVQQGICSIVSSLPDTIYNIITTFTKVVLNVVYALLAIITFIKVLKEKILDGFVLKNEVKEIKTKTKSNKKNNDVVIEKEIKEKVIYKNERTFLDSIGDLFIVLFKIFAAFLILFAIFALICSAIIFAALILFSIKYTFFFGPILAALGLLIGCIWLTEILYRFIAGKKGEFKRSFITFITAIVLCGFGIGITLIEITDIKIENYENNEVLIGKYEFNYNNVNTINNWYSNDVSKTINNKLKDNEILVYAYGNDFQIPNYSINDKSVSFTYNTDDSKIIKNILSNIKENKIYNYNSGSLIIKVEANEKTLNKIKLNVYNNSCEKCYCEE